MNCAELHPQHSRIMNASLRQKSGLWYRRSLRSLGDKMWPSTGGPGQTQHRGPCQRQTGSNSLVDYTDPQRSSHTLEKQDNETYGFEVQTYGVQLRNVPAMEMCTFVCRVQKDSAAERAGLTAGDVIVTINGVSIEGSTHQHIIGLIYESPNILKVETVCGTVVKRIELEKKMSSLKLTLKDKRAELQVLIFQEKQLTGGQLNARCVSSSADSGVSLMSLSGGQRVSSDSSWLSEVTEDSDQVSVFGDLSSPSLFSPFTPSTPFSPFSSTSHEASFFPSSDPQQSGGVRPSSSTDPPHSSIKHRRSSSLAEGSPPPPSWEPSSRISLFGTLPRKSRRGSVRQLLNFLPGLKRSVEEEDI